MRPTTEQLIDHLEHEIQRKKRNIKDRLRFIDFLTDQAGDIVDPDRLNGLAGLSVRHMMDDAAVVAATDYLATLKGQETSNG